MTSKETAVKETLRILNGVDTDIYFLYKKICILYQGKKVWDKNRINEDYIRKIFSFSFIREKLGTAVGSFLKNVSEENLVAFALKVYNESNIPMNTFYESKNFGERHVIREGYIEKKNGTFRITEKATKEFGLNTSPDHDPIEKLIDEYKEIVKKEGFEQEIYKWKLIKKFYGKPDVDSKNFASEIKALNAANLAYQYFGSSAKWMLDRKPEEYRKNIKDLFNEKISLIDRIDKFISSVSELFDSVKSKENDSSHHDERSISVFLTYRYPEKYVFYKYSYYKKYCDLLEINPRKVKERYPHYLELIENLVENYIKKDSELQNLLKEALDDDCFDDENFKVLAQDILFRTLERKEDAGETTKLDYIKNLEITLVREIQQTKDFFNNKEAVEKHFKNVLPERKTYHQYGTKGRISKNTPNDESIFLLFTYRNEFVGGCFTKGAPLKNEDEEGYTYFSYDLCHAILWFNKSISKENMENDIIGKKIQGGNNFKDDTFEDYRQVINKIIDLGYLKEEDITLMETEGEPEMKGKENNLYRPLNLIFYGPPGTGKTYNTVNRALEIIGEDISGKTRKNIKALFDAKVKEGQIVFTTFHQSMSYEDFIEGIKPDMNNESLKYGVKPGIFRKICEDARTEDNFDDAYEKAIGQVSETGLELKTPQQNKPFSVFINSAKSFVAKPKTEVATEMTITKEMVRNYLENGIVKDWKPYLIPISEYINKNYGPINFGKNEKNYVLIIDEINRGNISQIFGELITLIEEDKRVGKDEALEIVLSYSKDKFSVPSNLYIIGTMNTADRSVEALDTALRRRFCFKEMPPIPEIIATEGRLRDKKGIVEGINLPALLETINNRIEKLLDRDHKIGHSYFMSVENIDDLKNVFQNNIIPLLQEYFFGDYGKIGLVLGKGFFEDFETDENDLFADFGEYDASDFATRKIYRLKNCSDMKKDAFLEALNLMLG